MTAGRMSRCPECGSRLRRLADRTIPDHRDPLGLPGTLCPGSGARPSTGRRAPRSES